MSHALTIGLLRALRREACPANPAQPHGTAPPFRVRVFAPRREPAWRDAMRWSLIGLTASLVAGEVALLLQGF